MIKAFTLSSIVVSLLLLALLSTGCEKTIKEPGEPEHGGAFLQGDPGNPPSTQQ